MSASRVPAARSCLLFRKISAELSKLPGPLQEPPLPLLAFFRGRRWISELVDLLACEGDGLRWGFRAEPLHRLRPCQPQLDKPTDGLGAARFIGLPCGPGIHIFAQFGRKSHCRYGVCAGPSWRAPTSVTPNASVWFPVGPQVRRAPFRCLSIGSSGVHSNAKSHSWMEAINAHDHG